MGDRLGHVSIFQLLLHSQPVKHPADILADARDFAFDALKFCRWSTEQTSSLVFPARRLRPHSSHSMM